MRFAEMTAPEIREIARDTTLILAPIAACEQHGDHLPVSTDTILVNAVADGVEKALPNQVVLLPVMWLGASEHHLPFGGTLTASLSTYELMLMELLTPVLIEGFRRVMLLNGHGGNIDPLHVALRRLDTMFPKAFLSGAAYWEIAEKEIAAHCDGPRKVMGHACEIETSMMMHLRPDLVRKDKIADDPDLTPIALDRLFWARNFARRTARGAVGHPRMASAEKGKLMLDAAIAGVTRVAEATLNLPLEK